jgi:hypothetical protein
LCSSPGGFLMRPAAAHSISQHKKDLQALGADVMGNRGQMLHLILRLIQQVERAFEKTVDGGQGGECTTLVAVEAMGVAPAAASARFLVCFMFSRACCHCRCHCHTHCHDPAIGDAVCTWKRLPSTHLLTTTPSARTRTQVSLLPSTCSSYDAKHHYVLL